MKRAADAENQAWLLFSQLKDIDHAESTHKKWVGPRAKHLPLTKQWRKDAWSIVLVDQVGDTGLRTRVRVDKNRRNGRLGVAYQTYDPATTLLTGHSEEETGGDDGFT